MGIDLEIKHNDEYVSLGRASYYEPDMELDQLRENLVRLVATGMGYHEAFEAVQELDDLIQEILTHGRSDVIKILKDDGFLFKKE